MRPHPSEPHTHREEGTSPMQRRKLPDRHEAVYLTIVVACLVGIMIICLTAG